MRITASHAASGSNLRMTSVWAGGGTRGGQVIGKTDATGNSVAEYGWSANRDVRPEDVTCTIYSALGINPHNVIEQGSL